MTLLTASDSPSAPAFRGTLVLLVSLAVAGGSLGWDGAPSSLAARCAWIVGIGLAGALLSEVPGRDSRTWFRTDWAALAAAYYLTLVEFLVAQPRFDQEIAVGPAREALTLVLFGLAALALGRHFVPPRVEPLPERGATPIRVWVGTLAGAFLVGYLPMFSAVDYHSGRWFEELLGPRFSQSWARGRLGDQGAFFSELQLLTYLVPPLAAWIAVRSPGHPWKRGLALVPFAFVLFVAFCSGTRYVFATHLATFAASLAWALPPVPWKRAWLLFAGLGLALLIVTVVAVQFRHAGLAGGLRPTHTPRFVVDQNLRTLARLTEAFPEDHPHLGAEVLGHIVVRPIPRALFPDKPEKLTHSMEDVMGIPGTTIASTFVGEGFLMAGLGGTLLFGFALGAVCGAWNRLSASRSAGNLILHAAGFHWALLATRSPIWITVGLLPCLAFFVLMIFLSPRKGSPS